MVKTITKISTQKQAGRYNVDLDGKFAFGVAESVLIKFGLAKGRELDEALIEDIQAADEVARALKAALHYLSRQLRTQHQVRQKLIEQAIDERVIDTVMTQLQAQRYVDDAQYAQNFLNTQQQVNGKGPTVIRQGLLKVGVPEELIEKTLQHYTRADEIQHAQRWLEKLWQHYQRESLRQRQQKMIQALATKGFHFDVAQQVVQQFSEAHSDDNLVEQELANVIRQAEKYWRRYAKLYESQRVFKTKQNLFAKGYRSEHIDEAIQRILHESQE